MASRSIVSRLDNDPWSICSAFSALMEVVVASLYLLSACISVTASVLVRFFDVRPPCFCINREEEASNKVRKQDHCPRLPNDWNSHNRFALQNLLLTGGFASVRDSMLLDCSSTETEYVNNEGDAEEIYNRYLPPGAVIYVDNCNRCLLKSPRSSLTPPLIEEIEDNDSTNVQSEAGSDSGSPDSFVQERPREHMVLMHSRCARCQKEIKEKQHRGSFVKGKFAKVFVEDFEDKIWDSSESLSQGVEYLPFHEIKKGGISGEGSSTKHSEAALRGDSYSKKAGSYSDDPLSYPLDTERCIDLLPEDRVAFGSMSPQISNENCVETETHPVEDCTIEATLPFADMETCHLSQPKSDADVIKELRAALEAEREAYSALYAELEEERNAAAIAANETMAMISRLQEEKAAVVMETRQFKRVAEEKAAFDQKAISLLKEIICKREEEKFVLEKEVETYRSDHRTKALRRQKQRKAGLQQTGEKNNTDRGLLLLESRKHQKIMRESQSSQEAFELSTFSCASEHNLSGKDNSTERASTCNRREDSKNMGQADLLASLISKDSVYAIESIGTNHDHSLIDVVHERENNDTYSEVNPHETSSGAAEDICQEDLVELSDVKDKEDATIEQSLILEDKGKFEEQADELQDRSYDPSLAAYAKEPLSMGGVGLKNWVSTIDNLAQGSSKLPKNVNLLEGTTLEESDTLLSPSSQKCRDVVDGVCDGNGFHMESCIYDCEPLEDFITIEVDPRTMKTHMKPEYTDSMNCLRPIDARTKSSSVVGDEIGEEVYHSSPPEELLEHPYSAHINSTGLTVQSLLQDDQPTRGSRSKGIDSSKNLTLSSFPKEQCVLHDRVPKVNDEPEISAKNLEIEVRQELENRLPPGMIVQRGQNRENLCDNQNSKESDEWTTDDDLYQDSELSADEYLPEYSRGDVRTASMIRRDDQRHAVEEEVQQLTLRLQLLEDDRNSTKSILETLRSEHGESCLLQDIAQQLQQLLRFEKKLEDLKGFFVHSGQPTEVSEDSENTTKKRRR